MIGRFRRAVALAVHAAWQRVFETITDEGGRRDALLVTAAERPVA